MEITTQTTTPLHFVATQFTLQQHLLKNVLDGLEDVATNRPNEMTNHIAWIAGHMVSTRCWATQLLGGTANEPHPDLFANGKGLDADATYPTLAESMASFNEVSSTFSEALASAAPDILNAEAPFPVPTGKTIADMIAFLAHHEAYHIGQIGILRRVFEKESMSYS